MRDPIEIVPGLSIGPVVLGMTRKEVLRLEVGPPRSLENGTAIVIPLGTDPTAREGITAFFGPDGACCRIEAFFAPGPPLFRLRGRIVNGLPADEVEAAFRECSPDLHRGYGSVAAPAAGISGVKWERGDPDLCAIDVFPPGT